MKKLAILFLMLTMVTPARADFLEKKEVKIGSAVPDFTLNDLDGKPVSLSGLKGSVVMIHFWSAQCPFVIRYESRLGAITADYADKGVKVLGIDSNVTETPEQMKGVAAERKLNYPVLVDPGHIVADKFGAITTPHVFIIDKEGKLAYEGAVDDQGYSENNTPKTNYARAALDAVLAGTPVAEAKTKTVGCTVKRN